MAVSAPGQLTLLAPRAVVAGLASAGAVPLVTVLRVLLHALALLGAAGAERPLGASWVGRRRTASDPGGQISQTGGRKIATTQHWPFQGWNLKGLQSENNTHLIRKVWTRIPRWQYRPYKPGSHRQAP